MNKKITYKDAGVDIKKADEAIEMSKRDISSTFNKNVLSSIGGFGSMYSLKDLLKDFDDPVLVQSIDGVGTKMSVAMAANNFQYIGHDLVNACCNDVAATGAAPLTFLDYVAGSNLDKNIVYQDNKSAMLLEKNGRQSAGKRSRALNVRYFFMTDQIEKGNLTVEYCPTDDMTGDYMTKPLFGAKFKKFRDEILGK